MTKIIAQDFAVETENALKTDAFAIKDGFEKTVAYQYVIQNVSTDENVRMVSASALHELYEKIVKAQAAQTTALDTENAIYKI